ncbi:HAD family hydrolase [Rathayibacter toxicus]|uniref:HAD family hydrolase n=1 Tax=Rathayibacter toxicus TaxID=145458 RepID=UPI000CE82CA2|nr:HAD family hydrolase [Rathayibacter toxicus]PPI56064.1 hypothetical protein C5D35_02230 [Rathayibacter toxicus]QOD10140.1 HAD family hydrolase [Rathayibacter toxicus]QWL28818.1 HAD family hydrolase [Rathayibacter toxicus]
MNRPPIEGILFDLDDTLLDHSGAAAQAFSRWACTVGIDPSPINRQRWRKAEHSFSPEPHNGVSMTLTRALRMQHFFESAASDRAPLGYDELVKHYHSYLANYKSSWRLYGDTLDSLDRLRPYFRLGILTNGAAVMQHCKIQRTGLTARVDLVVISEEIGYAKPALEAFTIACDRLSLLPEQVLHVGDDLRIDVDGALGAGLNTTLIDRNSATGETALQELASQLLTG